jgi:hypothetical protein
MARRFLLIACLLGTSSVLACASDDADPPPTTNGVNDVGKACTVRAQWTQATSSPCVDCLAEASVPRCSCSTKDYAGRCSTQQTARNADQACADVASCVVVCKAGDCGCVDQCYANKDACRPLGGAVDGCLAEVCAPFCR